MDAQWHLTVVLHRPGQQAQTAKESLAPAASAAPAEDQAAHQHAEQAGSVALTVANHRWSIRLLEPRHLTCCC
jgi:hypothetical protein